MPKALKERYDSEDVERLPDFSKIDAMFGDGHRCCDKYSNPRFFIDQWAAKELRELERLKEEKDARKAERKLRRKMNKRREKQRAEIEGARAKTAEAGKHMNWKARYGMDGDDIATSPVAAANTASKRAPHSLAT